ncbi:MAG: 50S ribosomal protein L29 [Flavobacteriales bacterium]|nr:50S ribosomal protein L29 [Flavobacteriales bacterium]MBL0128672.1 50S ribosomal protein L29 [Flavobacteriales bacterium]MCC6937452.1 50S ribosomal protein L29 [Flavobacteriales bacterium]
MKKKGLELKDLNVQELQDKLKEERTALTKVRFSHTVSPVENPMQLRSKRKEVARILTELRKRELTAK